METTFKYHLLRSYMISLLLVVLGFAFLSVLKFNVERLVITGGIVILYTVSCWYILRRQYKNINIRVFSALYRSLGRQVAWFNLVGIITGFIIYLIVGPFIEDSIFPLALGLIIAGIGMAFGSYIQIKTLRATGLYDGESGRDDGTVLQKISA